MASSSCSSPCKQPRSADASWENITHDILVLIFDKQIFLADFIKAGTVCKQWRLVYLTRKQHRIQRCNEVPILLISKKKHLFSLFEGKHYGSMLKIPNYMRWICSHSYGWLAAQNQDLSITLFSPFCRDTIELPVCDTNYHRIPTVIFSCNPRLYFDTCVKVHMIGGEYLCTIMSGEKKWRIRRIPNILHTSSILFYKAKLWIVDLRGQLWVQDESNDQTFKPIVELQDPGPLYLYIPLNPFHLVESSRGELLLVNMFRHYSIRNHYCFKVFKLKGRSWEGVDVLDDDEALLIGESGGVCIRASGFPNVRRNCIYYAVTHKHNRVSDVGVYSLGDKRCRPICKKDFARGTWIFPTLY